MTLDPASAVRDYVDYLTGEALTPPDLRTLDPDAAAHVRALCHLADLLWEANAAPPLASDPVAAMLGLVPDPAIMLDPRKLKSARMRTGLKVSQVAERLHHRGWDTSTADVASWERQADPRMAPALIEALSTVLSVDLHQLTAPGHTAPPSVGVMDTVLASDRFASLARRWSEIYGITQAAAQSALRSTMLATARRGEQLSADQWYAVLKHLVEAHATPEDPA